MWLSNCKEKFHKVCTPLRQSAFVSDGEVLSSHAQVKLIGQAGGVYILCAARKQFDGAVAALACWAHLLADFESMLVH